MDVYEQVDISRMLEALGVMDFTVSFDSDLFDASMFGEVGWVLGRNTHCMVTGTYRGVRYTRKANDTATAMALFLQDVLE